MNPYTTIAKTKEVAHWTDEDLEETSNLLETYLINKSENVSFTYFRNRLKHIKTELEFRKLSTNI